MEECSRFSNARRASPGAGRTRSAKTRRRLGRSDARLPWFYRWREREYPKMFPDGKYPPNTLLIIDRLVQEQFLLEIQTIAAV